MKKLNDLKYIQKLLNIIDSNIANLLDDTILSSIMEIFVCLSEENSEWCNQFLNQNGLSIYSRIINTFENDMNVMSKALALIVKFLNYCFNIYLISVVKYNHHL
jgi:hypothetical protein